MDSYAAFKVKIGLEEMAENVYCYLDILAWLLQAQSTIGTNDNLHNDFQKMTINNCFMPNWATWLLMITKRGKNKHCEWLIKSF